MTGGTLLADAAEVLRLPVIGLTFAALAVACWELGRFGTELIRRVRGRRRTAAALAAAADARALPAALSAALPSRAVAAAASALVACGADVPAQERALAGFELAAQRRLEPVRLLVRVGPALGLMGTLIPLAPGLGAVAEGDVATLATELRTAFAATVLGLAVGTVGFAISVVRARLYAEDLELLEGLAGRLREPACGA
jgi:biopolymer transport protein ExbB/TolQ